MTAPGAGSAARGSRSKRSTSSRRVRFPREPVAARTRARSLRAAAASGAANERSRVVAVHVVEREEEDLQRERAADDDDEENAWSHGLPPDVMVRGRGTGRDDGNLIGKSPGGEVSIPSVFAPKRACLRRPTPGSKRPFVHRSAREAATSEREILRGAGRSTHASVESRAFAPGFRTGTDERTARRSNPTCRTSGGFPRDPSRWKGPPPPSPGLAVTARRRRLRRSVRGPGDRRRGMWVSLVRP